MLKRTEFVYAGNWRSTCRRTYQLLPRCTQNPLHKAAVIHHLKYRRSLLRRLLGILILHSPKKSVSGLEICGWDCIPLCYACHENSYGRSLNRKSVHYSKVWIRRGGLNNHNVSWFKYKLRFQFLFWAILFNIGKLFFMILRK